MDQFASSDLLDLPLDYWQRRALDFLGPFFAGTRHLVRISTGFFSIQGYNLLRPYLEGKRVHIMVGYDERSRQDLHKALLDEIMDDLSRWHEARRSAVAMLVAALRAGDVRIIEARTRLNDHAKVFLFDEQVAISGSTNVTRNGLLSNFEGNLGISTRTDPVRVTWWQATFTQLWNHPDTTDITNELLERLEAWLRLRNPWEIYLKTMQALVPEDKPTPPRTSYKTPTEFQLVVIQRALRQLTTLRGAMIVASTGLGKTIMGTHIAYELRHTHQRILNVLVFAPKHLKDEWRRRLRSAGLGADAIFTLALLDKSDLGQGSDGDVKRMLEVLAELDEQWLIIIDESQYFRHNIRANGDPRLAHERLQDAVARSKCLVLLLTATPFATNVEDLQGQLCILPHTAPQVQPQLPGLADTTEAAWTVTQVADLMAIPVSTVINTPYVAQYYAVDDGDGKGDYILFGAERRYIPRIHIRQIRYPPLEDSALKKARKTGVFQHQPLRYRRRKKWGVSKDQIEQHIALAAESSPAALLDVLNQVIASTSDGGYRVMYHR
ncbi:MAG: hypothetical protein EOM24_20745, partial [Chloroflexia bacterium]|nr:hypothetical protein [Chloroflexia bacterium]